MSGIDRRQFIKTGVGGTAVAVFSLPTSAQENSKSADLTRREARYIKKHAAMRAITYKKFAQRFNLTTDEVEEQFVEGLPFNPYESRNSIAINDIFINFIDISVGGKLGDVMTVAWYSDSFKTSGIKSVFNRGIKTGTSGTPIGPGDEGSQRAREENKALASAARQVAQSADNFLSNSSTSTRDSLRQSIENEQQIIENETDTIRKWAQIEPDSYQSIGAVDDGASIVMEFSKRNVRALEEFSDDVNSQMVAVGSTKSQLFLPQFLSAYEQNIEDLRSDIPSTFRNMLFGQSMNIYFLKSEVSRNSDKIVQGFNFETANDGSVVSYDLLPSPDAAVHILTKKSVVEQIANSSNPVSTAQSALDDGQIVIDGQGLVNDIQYETLPGIYDAANNVVDGVSDAVDSISDILS
jgi:hypothetical protein